jgi:phage gp46-like protein
MADIRYLQQLDMPAYAVSLDWLQDDMNLLAEGLDLQSAVIIALGTDALAPVELELPDPDSTDRRGWWGDTDASELWGGWPVGSLLWLLHRAKITGPTSRSGSTLAQVDGWTRDAMRPFVENRIASRIDVQPTTTDTNRIDVDVTIYRGPDLEIELRYADLWDELGRA